MADPVGMDTTEISSAQNALRLPEAHQTVLLLNPPVYDTRLPWVQWQQPTLLLRLGAYARRVGADVRLVDMLHRRYRAALRRERVALLELDGLPLNKWRFGLAKSALLTQLRELRKAGWKPDLVYCECFTTFWWEGAAEAIASVRQIFPTTHIILLGGYAQIAPQHARAQSGADEVVEDPASPLPALPADFSLYDYPPTFTYLSLGGGTRTAEEVVAEVEARAAGRKGQHFAFVEHGIVHEHPFLFQRVLERLADHRLQANFYALGSISPADLVAHPDLAQMLCRAGFEEIHFADDRDMPQDTDADEQLVEDYRHAAQLCHRAGFAARTVALSAGICIGRPDEDLSARARVATLAAHHIGSVILWPYQPSPAECPDLSLDMQNGKLFPFRTKNGHSYRDYLDIMGLAVVLNAKYRDRTFDFLGDGLVARLFRDSLSRQSWDPDPAVKGTLQLPVRIKT